MAASVFISGMGIVSSLGIGVEDTWSSIQENKSGVGAIEYLKTVHQIPCAEVKFSNEELLEKSHIPSNIPITRTVLLGVLALKEAIEDAHLMDADIEKTAFISGTTVGGMDKSEMYYQDFLSSLNHSEYIAIHDCGSCTDQIADFVGRFKSMTTISTACSSGANAMILGANMIKSGMLDIAIVGGSECLTRFHLNGFNSLMILDKENCRPFCDTRNGLNLGEGAAYLVLESEASINRRKITPLCELAGYANTCDAYHQTASSPEGKGAVLAMRNALKNASILPKEIDYINAHGTATPNNDESEARAIETVFGEKMPFVSSTKAHTGHTTSAAGAVEAVISILSLHHQIIPPTLNHRKDMSTKINLVKSMITDSNIRYIMSNSFGFGGNNTSIIIKKCI